MELCGLNQTKRVHLTSEIDLDTTNRSRYLLSRITTPGYIFRRSETIQPIITFYRAMECTVRPEIENIQEPQTNGLSCSHSLTQKLHTVWSQLYLYSNLAESIRRVTPLISPSRGTKLRSRFELLRFKNSFTTHESTTGWTEYPAVLGHTVRLT